MFSTFFKTPRAAITLGWVIACFSLSPAISCAQDDPPPVGMSYTIEGLFLPGTELRAKPLDDPGQPVVVRIVNAFPHGTAGFRYDFHVTGYEPGEFELRDYLERMDGTSTADLPSVPVRFRSVLPSNQIQPNALEVGRLPRLGGYKFWLTVGLVVWGVVLIAAMTVGRSRRAMATEKTAEPSLAELLQPRLQAAMDGNLDPRQYAELERMLIALLQKRLNLGEVDPTHVVGTIRRHPDVGPLMQQLERWMHDPHRSDGVDLAALLQPMRGWTADADERTAIGGLPGGNHDHMTEAAR